MVASELDNFFTGGISDGSFALTTPAGDTITAIYGGSFSFIDANTVAFVSPGQITGGTGRFRGATGTITFSGTASALTASLSGRFVATLTLPGD